MRDLAARDTSLFQECRRVMGKNVLSPARRPAKRCLGQLLDKDLSAWGWGGSSLILSVDTVVAWGFRLKGRTKDPVTQKDRLIMKKNDCSFVACYSKETL